MAPPYSGAYAASKHALEALTESLHFEVSHLGLRVHLIEPGRFPTNFSDNIVFPPAWKDSPHEERALAFRESLTSLDGGGPQPTPNPLPTPLLALLLTPRLRFESLSVGTPNLLTPPSPQ